MNFTLKVTRNHLLVQMFRTHSIRLFLKNLRTINWKDGHPRVYIRVTYGRREDNFGKVVLFYNDGLYDNKRDLLQAFRAFCEEEEAS